MGGVQRGTHLDGRIQRSVQLRRLSGDGHGAILAGGRRIRDRDLCGVRRISAEGSAAVRRRGSGGLCEQLRGPEASAGAPDEGAAHGRRKDRGPVEGERRGRNGPRSGHGGLRGIQDLQIPGVPRVQLVRGWDGLDEQRTGEPAVREKGRRGMGASERVSEDLGAEAGRRAVGPVPRTTRHPSRQ